MKPNVTRKWAEAHRSAYPFYQVGKVAGDWRAWFPGIDMSFVAHPFVEIPSASNTRN